MTRSPPSRRPRPPAIRNSRDAGEPSDADDLLELFAVIGGAEVRRMFGGRGVFRDGLMFALQARGEVYLKVDPAFAERLAGLGATPFEYVGATRMVTLPYWTLPDAARDDDDLRGDLLRQSLAVAHAAAARKGPKRTGRVGKTGARTIPAAADSQSVPPDFNALGLAGPDSVPDATPARARRARSASKPATVPPRRAPRT